MRAPSGSDASVEAASATGSSATMRLNDERGGVEIVFSGRPSDEVIASLKAHRFRWSRGKRLWYAKQSESTIAFARGLAGEVNKSEAVTRDSGSRM